MLRQNFWDKLKLRLIDYDRYVLYKDSEKKIHGLMTLVRKGIPSERIQSKYESPVESLIIQTRTADGQKLEVQNLYISPSTEWEPELIKHLPDHKCMYLGDFNAKHPNWNNSGSNNRGKALNELLMSSPYNVINTNTTSTKFDSNIDLCIADATLAGQLEVKTLSVLSDVHHPLYITLKTTAWLTKDSFVSRFAYKKADWPKFREALDKNICNLDWERYRKLNFQDIQTTDLLIKQNDIEHVTLSKKALNIINSLDIDRLDAIIDKCITAATELTIPRTKFHTKPWENWYWNEELENNKKKLRSLQNKRAKMKKISPALQ